MVDNNAVTKGSEQPNPVLPLGATVHYSIIQHSRRLYRTPTKNRIDCSRYSISNYNFTGLSLGSNMEVLFSIKGNLLPGGLKDLKFKTPGSVRITKIKNHGGISPALNEQGPEPGLSPCKRGKVLGSSLQVTRGWGKGREQGWQRGRLLKGGGEQELAFSIKAMCSYKCHQRRIAMTR